MWGQLQSLAIALGSYIDIVLWEGKVMVERRQEFHPSIQHHVFVGV